MTALSTARRWFPNSHMQCLLQCERDGLSVLPDFISRAAQQSILNIQYFSYCHTNLHHYVRISTSPISNMPSIFLHVSSRFFFRNKCYTGAYDVPHWCFQKMRRLQQGWLRTTGLARMKINKKNCHFIVHLLAQIIWVARPPCGRGQKTSPPEPPVVAQQLQPRSIADCQCTSPLRHCFVCRPCASRTIHASEEGAFVLTSPICTQIPYQGKLASNFSHAQMRVKFGGPLPFQGNLRDTEYNGRLQGAFSLSRDQSPTIRAPLERNRATLHYRLLQQCKQAPLQERHLPVLQGKAKETSILKKRKEKGGVLNCPFLFAT